jgi:hypothetical protein
LPAKASMVRVVRRIVRVESIDVSAKIIYQANNDNA